jgi:hypothetical protein
LDNLGNAHITGIACDTSFSNCVYITIKYLSNGITAWMSKYNEGFWAHNIAVDLAGNVYVTGEDDDVDFATVKYDKSGNQLWARKYSKPGYAENIALAVVVDDNQNVYVTGYSRLSWYVPYNCNYTTIKYGPSGNQVWLKTYGTLNSDDEPRAMARDRFGNVYVTGVTGYSWNNGYTDNCCTIKYDSSGNQVWVQIYDSLGLNDETRAIAVDDSSNVYVTGYSNHDDGNPEWGRDYLIIKYTQHLRGDWDKDGFINISDVIHLLNYLFLHDNAPQPMEIGNINCDEVIDVGDVIYLINYIFKSGPEPSCI